MSSAVADVVPEARLVEWVQRFVRYPSPQTDAFEAEPAVQGFIGECVAPLVEELGLPQRRDPMGNLLVELGPARREPGLLLMTYAMTHPAAAMERPYEAELVDTDRGAAVRGRGVSEQKGALAAALAATAAMHGQALRGRLVLAVSTAGETGRHDAAAAMLAALDAVPRLGVVVIGTSGRVSLANKGRLDVVVRVRGRAAHSSTPWAGVDAVEGLRQVLDQLAGLAFDAGDHPTLGRATLTPTFIETEPRATHTVQAAATLTLDRRLLPGQDAEGALAELRGGLALPAPWSLEVEPGAYMEACEIAQEGELMRSITAGCRLAGVAAPEPFYSHGALDAGYLVRQGCEATMWGPGPMDRWHSDEELVAVRDIVAGAEAYHGLIRACLGEAR